MQDSLGSLKQRDHFEDLGVDGRIILKWILNCCIELYVFHPEVLVKQYRD